MTALFGKSVLPGNSDQECVPKRQRSFPSRGFVLALLIIAVLGLTSYFGNKVYRNSTIGLIHALDGNHDEASDARQKLSAMGASVVPALFEQMDGSRSPISVFAESTILFIGKPAVPFILEKLHSPVHSVAARAALVLGRLGEREAVPELAACLATDDEELKICCVKALGTAGGDAALDSLIPVARDPSPIVRAAVSKELSQFQSPKLIPVFERMLDDSDSAVRVYACQGLGGCLSPNATWKIARLASDAAPGVRKALARELGAQDDAQAVAILESLLQDPSEDVRVSAMYSLFDEREMISLEALSKAMHDPNDSVREMAIGAIAAQASPDALALLVEYSKTSRDEVGWSIGNMPSSRVGAFLSLLVSEDPVVRANAAVLVSSSDWPNLPDDLAAPVREVIRKFGDTWNEGRFLDKSGEENLQSLRMGGALADRTEADLRAQFRGRIPKGRKAIIEWLEDLLIQRQMILRGEGR